MRSPIAPPSSSVLNYSSPSSPPKTSSSALAGNALSWKPSASDAYSSSSGAFSLLSSARKAVEGEWRWALSELLSGELICKGVASATVGAVLGMITSLIVNCTLVEVSMSPFFAMYFGLLFISVGGVILWRLNGNVSEQAQARKLQLMFFALLIILSGILCFVLERNWFIGLNRFAKVPIYVLLGISIAFALTFSLVDLINYTMGLVQHTLARPLVESKNQVYLVLCLSLVKGALFGLVFGVMDVEDEAAYHFRLALLREEHFCYPIGAVLGAVAGFGNEYLRQKEETLNRKRMGEFDEEI
eukprot:GHVS01050118.1.p1 GENE.GHVS01050118.1~~GHVS01050118.1.p1  ORF type:complete len:301 (+),score=49.25 GHVS01050118.1:283-1185(+)